MTMSDTTLIVAALIVGWIAGMFTAAGIVRGGTARPTPHPDGADKRCSIFPCFDAAEHGDWMCRRCEKGVS